MAQNYAAGVLIPCVEAAGDQGNLVLTCHVGCCCVLAWKRNRNTSRKDSTHGAIQPDNPQTSLSTPCRISHYLTQVKFLELESLKKI